MVKKEKQQQTKEKKEEIKKKKIEDVWTSSFLKVYEIKF